MKMLWFFLLWFGIGYAMAFLIIFERYAYELGLTGRNLVDPRGEASLRSPNRYF